MTSTFVAGLRHDGIAAPMLIDTPMTGRIFQQWLTDHLIPELPPGSIVVCDNLAAHKVDVDRRRAAGGAHRQRAGCDLPPRREPQRRAAAACP
jgi:transposase